MTSFVFVDARVRDAASTTLFPDLGDDSRIVLLDAATDGIEQILSALNGAAGVSAIHVVAHGAPGELYLGSTLLDGESLDRYAGELSAIGSALSDEGDILLYGCDVAKGVAGDAFIETLARYTRADVAASTDRTGDTGDWVLEKSTGTIEAATLQATAYPGALALQTYQTIPDESVVASSWYTSRAFAASIIQSGSVASSPVSAYSNLSDASDEDVFAFFLPAPGQHSLFYLPDLAILNNTLWWESVAGGIAVYEIVRDAQGYNFASPTFGVQKIDTLAVAAAADNGWNVAIPPKFWQVDFTVQYGAGQVIGGITHTGTYVAAVFANAVDWAVMAGAEQYDAGRYLVTLDGSTTLRGLTWGPGWINDITPGPSLSIAAESANKPEGNTGTTAFTFTVTRSGVTTGETTVDWAVVPSGTSPSADLADFGGTYPSGTLHFADGETTKTVTVNLTGDGIYESGGVAENFTVILSDPSEGAKIATPSANGQIQNDDTALSIAAADADKLEGNSGTTPFTFTVTRAGATTGATTVNWAAGPGGTSPSADAADFGGAFPSGTLNFAAGETVKTVTVNVNGDTDYESGGLAESFTVTLSDASGGAAITTPTAAGHIQNDDAKLSIAAADADQPEGNSGTTPFTFTVTREGATSGTTTVGWTVGGGGDPAADGDDFSADSASGTITFLPGQSTKTITVEVIGDTVYEGNEAFTVTLSNASGGATIGTAEATGTIRNDDVPPGGAVVPPDDPQWLEAHDDELEFIKNVADALEIYNNSLSGISDVLYAGGERMSSTFTKLPLIQSLATNGYSATARDLWNARLTVNSLTHNFDLVSKTIDLAKSATEGYKHYQETGSINDSIRISSEKFLIAFASGNAGAFVGGFTGTLLVTGVGMTGLFPVVVSVGLGLVVTHGTEQVLETFFQMGHEALPGFTQLPGPGNHLLSATGDSVTEPKLHSHSFKLVSATPQSDSAPSAPFAVGDIVSPKWEYDLATGEFRWLDPTLEDSPRIQMLSKQLLPASGDQAGLTIAGDQESDLQDVILGSPYADELRGLTDNDIIVGADGADAIYGGTGDDLLMGDGGADQLAGDGGDDILDGGDGNDTLAGDGDADTLTGGAGDDQLDGGDGTDTAVFDGTRSQYTIVQQVDGPVTVSDQRDGAPDGTDTVSNVESFQFADGTVTLAQLLQADKTAALLIYDWKAHTLLDGVSVTAGAATHSTDAGGSASFDGVTDDSLTLTASRSIPAAETALTSQAVNLQDAIAILKMIVGLDVNGAGKPLSPYQTLAADYDGDGTVGLTDAIGVLKHVVGLPSPDPVWRFVSESDMSIPGKVDLNPGTLPDTINADVSAAVAQVHVGLVGILIGDVDGSFAGAAGSQDLDLLQPTYFADLTYAHGLQLSQFGVYT